MDLTYGSGARGRDRVSGRRQEACPGGGGRSWSMRLAAMVGVVWALGAWADAVALPPLVVLQDDDSRLFTATWDADSAAFVGFRRVATNIWSNARCVVMADFNNDGALDVVAARADGTAIWVCYYRNDGANRLTDGLMVGQQGDTGSWAMDGAAGDLNNDGCMDFVVSSNSDTFGVYLGDGRGNFVQSIIPDLEASGRGTDLADFNHDGNLDVVRAAYSSGNVRVLPGNGDGTFGTPVLVSDVGDDPYGVCAGDFDGDGHPDIIANAGGSGDAALLRGNGDLTFQSAVAVAAVDFGNLAALDAYDYDGDSKLDIVAAVHTNRVAYFCRGNGDGTFATAVRIGPTDIGSTVTGISAPPLPAGSPRPALAPATQTIAVGATAGLTGFASPLAGRNVAQAVWSDGDGSATATVGALPATRNHVYTTEGLYKARLTVTDDGTPAHTATAFATVRVQGAPPVIVTDDVTVTESTAYGGAWPIVLNASDYASDDAGIARCEWDLDDGFSTDFEDQDLSTWHPFAGTWSVSDVDPLAGSYSLLQSNVSTDRAWMLQDKVYDTDVVIETDVTMLAGDTEVMVVFGAQDARYNNLVIFRGRSGTNDVLFRYVSNGGETEYAALPLPVPFALNVPHHLMVARRGYWVEAYVDGAYVGGAPMGWNFPAGRVGLCTCRTSARFDNLTVRSIVSPSRSAVAGSAPQTLADNFEDGDRVGWQGSANWVVATGASAITGASSLRMASTGVQREFLLSDQSFSGDMVFEADMKMLSGWGEETMLIFGYRDASNYYELIYRGRGYSDILLRRIVSDTTQDLATFSQPAAPLMNRAYHLGVTRTGSILRVYLDRRLVGSCMDDTHPTGRLGFSTYYTETLYDNVSVRTFAPGALALHRFTAGTYQVRLTAVDGAGQVTSATIPMTFTTGQAPTVVAGGPYSVDEDTGDARAGGWTATLDGSQSTDPDAAAAALTQEWALPTDTFDGTVINSGRWTVTGGAVQNDALAVTGANSWGGQYAFTTDAFPRIPGTAFQCRVKYLGSISEAMVGFKADNTDYYWSQMAYGMDFSDGRLVPHEYYANRGETGYTFAYDTWYDYRIELLPIGARYYWRLSGSGQPWRLIRESTIGFSSPLRVGFQVYRGTMVIDDVSITVGGATPSVRTYGEGAHEVPLTVHSPGGGSATAIATVNNLANANPVANAGLSQTQDEADAVYGVWTFNFSGSASTDDFGIYRWEWDWDYDVAAGFVADSSGVSVSHSWTVPGPHIVALRATDHALRTHIVTVTITAENGTPPQPVITGGPYTVTEAAALRGGWPVTLDGSASADTGANPSAIWYQWDFGTEDFQTAAFDVDKWISGSGTKQTADGLVIETEASGTGGRYFVSTDTYPRAKGMTFEARLKAASDADLSMGFKNTTSDYSYQQWVYGLHFNGGHFYYLEDGTHTDLGVAFTADAWYDVRIELKESAGARYFVRPVGARGDWTLLRDSTYSSAAVFRRGFEVYGGTLTVASVRDLAAGPTPTWRFYAPGVYPVTLTVFDQAMNSASVGTTVTVENGTAPTANAGGNYTLDEAQAAAGAWVVPLNGSASGDAESSVARCLWDLGLDEFTGAAIDLEKWTPCRLGVWITDETVRLASIRGSWATTYAFSQGSYARAAGRTFQARVRYEGGHTMWGWKNTTTTYSHSQMPYALYFYPDGNIYVYEDNNNRGVKTSGKLGIWYDAKIELKETQGARYYLRPAGGEADWSLVYDSDYGTAADLTRGVDVHSGTFTMVPTEAETWITSGTDVRQANGELSVLGTYSWTDTYVFTRDTFTRADGLAFESTLKLTGGDYMIGWKNTSSSYHYNQLVYGLELYEGSIIVYEGGTSRYYSRKTYAYNQWYDFRIELKATAGARYYYRPHAAREPWTLIYDSDYSTETLLRRGVIVYRGTLTLDSVRETTAGATANYRFYETVADRDVTLTVHDQAGNVGTQTVKLTTTRNQPPVADAGGDLQGTEANAVEGAWTLNFSAAASHDDFGLYRYEWDWNYDAGRGFRASGDTGDSVWHTYFLSDVGSHTIAVRVTDDAMQTDVATATVTIGIGQPPTAALGADITAEVRYAVPFDGANSTDDNEVARYEWDFGDGSTGVGRTPSHIYMAPGDYAVTLVVYDTVRQASAPATQTVHVIEGTDPNSTAPVADPGGPYTAGVNGPVYLDGRNSSVSPQAGVQQGLARFTWDVDTAVNSDNLGGTDDDADLVSPTPMYSYAAAGVYTVRLTVANGAGQTDSDTTTVTVTTDNLAPEVICVPYRGLVTGLHPAISGQPVTLKGIVRDNGTAAQFRYQWDFGDGTAVAAPVAVTNKYAIEASHAFVGDAGMPFAVTLRVWDSGDLVGSDEYYVVIRPDTLEARSQIAVDEGLWYLHKTQTKTDGRWSQSYSGYTASPTASALQAFAINGNRTDGNPAENPYVETLRRGFDYLFSILRVNTIGVQTNGDPDTNHNGLGIDVNSGRMTYELGMVMDAVASSQTPLAVAGTGPADVKGRFFYDILVDMVDMYAWGQVDSGSPRGGWRYGWNGDADNSASQWAAIGMIAAEENFGINVPQFVKDENKIWLNTSYDGFHYGYTGAGTYAGSEYSWTNTTPSGLVQLAFCDVPTTDPWWRRTEDAIALNWPVGADRNLYGTFAMVKALRTARPQPVTRFQSTDLDWYNDPTQGIMQRLVGIQEVGGSWSGWFSNNGYELGRDLSTAWAVTMLTPSLFVVPPVAVIRAPTAWGYGVSLHLSAANSYHLNPSRQIVRYMWDFQDDGVFDVTTTDALDPAAAFTLPDPSPASGDAPVEVRVRLRVVDNNEPPQSDETTLTITFAEPPHAPYARIAGNPGLTLTAGITIRLDGSPSFDIDPSDHITKYEWDYLKPGAVGRISVLGVDGIADFVSTDSSWSPEILYTVPGVYDAALRVWDTGWMHDDDPLASAWEYARIEVEGNLPPVADIGGPYETDEDVPITLDGSLSSDPNADALLYAWRIETEDGSFVTADTATVDHTWAEPGTYDVFLSVSDSLLVAPELSATVTVRPVPEAPTDLALAANPLAENTPPNTLVGTFTTVDPDAGDTHTYSLVQGTGDGGNAFFSILGDRLVAQARLDYETVTQLPIRVRTTDTDGLFREESFVIQIGDMPEPPTAVHLAGGTVSELQPAGTLVGTLSATDPDAGATHTYSLVPGDGDTDNALFTIDGNTLVTAAELDYETRPVCGVRVRATDNGAMAFEAALQVTVLDVEEGGHIWYVDGYAGGEATGVSWDDAFSTLQQALEVAVPNDLVWVAQGVYAPPSQEDRNASFIIPPGVSVYGGFRGDETELGQRDVGGYPTALTGDIGLPGDPLDNCYHVVRFGLFANQGRAIPPARLDGFTVSDGTADDLFGDMLGGGVLVAGGEAVVANCILTANSAIRGGAIAVMAGALQLETSLLAGNRAIDGGAACVEGGALACTATEFVGNSASSFGGVLFGLEGEVLLDHCLAVGNQATYGGAVYAGYGCAVQATGSTLSGNRARVGGAALVEASAGLTIANSILWDDGAAVGPELLALGGVLDVSYSCVAGGVPEASVIDADPLFVMSGFWFDVGTPDDTADDEWVSGDYHLQSMAGHWTPGGWQVDAATSPCVDWGDPAADYGAELEPNGNRLNLGYYGNTPQASLTPEAVARAVIAALQPGVAVGLGTSVAVVPYVIACSEGDSLTFAVQPAAGEPPYHYRWTVNGNTAGQGAAELIFSPDFDAVRHPDAAADCVVACEVTDSATRSVATATWQVIRVLDRDRVPGAPEIEIVPSAPRTADDLAVEIIGEAADLDGDPILGTVAEWTLVGSGLWIEGNPLSALHTRKGDLWEVRVRAITCPYGAQSVLTPEADAATARVTIRNTPPEIDGVVVLPSPGYASLVAVPQGWVDADGDAAQGRCLWTVNGQPVPNHDAVALPRAFFAAGNQVVCQVTAWDGQDTGNTVTSAAVTVPDLTGAWALPLVVAGAATEDLLMAMHPGATDGVDWGLDEPAPPAPPVPAAWARFLAPDDSLLVTDVRGVSATADWWLAVEPGDQGVVLGWNSADVPAGQPILLAETDGVGRPLAGTLVNMAQTSHMAVPAGQTRFYAITAGWEAIALQLTQGWNLVSLPIVPRDPDVADIFAAPAARGVVYTGSVWGWDGTAYRVATQMVPLAGYWVYATAPVGVLVQGTPVLNPVVALRAGWNLVGPAESMAAPATAPVVTPVWGWNGVRYSVAAQLLPGAAYWLYARTAGNLALGTP